MECLGTNGKKGFWGTFRFYTLLMLILLPFMFVIFWMVLSSIKVNQQINQMPPVWFFKPTLENYINVLKTTPFLSYLWNSSVIAVLSTVISLILGLPAAYGIARYVSKFWGGLVLTARIFPGVSYLVPWFILFLNFGWIGEYKSIVLAHIVIDLPLVIWTMIPFFETLPQELEQAASIDGCSPFMTFLRVCLPLVKPGIVASAVLSFIYSWNDFKFALILTNSSTRTLPVSMFTYVESAAVDWGSVAASATLITLPTIIFVLFTQRHIVQGLTMGSIK